MRKETIFLIIAIITTIVIIIGINYIRGNGNYDDGVIKCIAEKSILVVSPTCSACAQQKLILGDYLNLFDIKLINENPDLVEQYDITKIPMWIIKGQKYEGVHSISSLKELAGC